MIAPSTARQHVSSLKVIKNVAISMLVMFITGAIYDLGVYNLAVDRALGSSNAVWSSSMAYMSVTGTVTMLLTGIILSSPQSITSSSQTRTLRLLCLFAAVSYMLLCVGVYAIRTNSIFLIRLAFASLGNGFGVYYLVGVELAASWLPHHASLVIGFCQMSFGLGSIVFTDVFSTLKDSMPIESAVLVTSAILSLPGLATCILVEWPPKSFSLSFAPSESDSHHKLHHIAVDGRPISWKLLPRLPLFWLYVAAISSAQAGYMFIPFFFDLGDLFKANKQAVIRCFQAINLLGTICRPLMSTISDAAKYPSGFFSIGTKNVTMGLLATQLFIFTALIPISNMNWFGAFVVCSGIAVVLFAVAACLSALLARELFGRSNSSLIFGVGGSIAMGLGEFVAVCAVERLTSRNVFGPSAYNTYYLFAVTWTILGFLASLFLQKSPDAFGEGVATVSDDYGSTTHMPNIAESI